MLFSSISFLYYFLPLFLLLYFCMPGKLKNFILLLGSLLFYFFGEPVYILILLFSSVVDYINGLLLDKISDKRLAKLVLASSIIINVGLLSVFKYSGFFIDNINSVFNTGMVNPQLALPLGISFYTFQTMSYTIDVYRGRVKAQRSFLKFAAYVTMFPQLVAGPIVRYSSVDNQLTDRRITWEGFSSGVSRFIIGLAKKVLLANNIGQLSALAYELCNQGSITSGSNASILLYWIGAASFAMQIYFDFSGYSDMAIGLGRMMGFDFPENFNYPFMARSLTDFWRRWHMTLGSWFKDYVYFPLGGNRVSTGRWIFNIAVVWGLTGFWHGASWNFVIWGLYFALFLVMEKLFIGKWLGNAPSFLAHGYTLILLLFSFVIFDTVDMGQLSGKLLGLFGLTIEAGSTAIGSSESTDSFFNQLSLLPLYNDITIYYVKSFAVLIFACLIGCTPIISKVAAIIRESKRSSKLLNILEPILLAALLIISTAYIVDSSFNPFLYFRF